MMLFPITFLKCPLHDPDCDEQPSFYTLNQFIYETPEDGKICKSLFCSDE
jgi:hypothetical protein